MCCIWVAKQLILPHTLVSCSVGTRGVFTDTVSTKSDELGFEFSFTSSAIIDQINSQSLILFFFYKIRM